MTVDANGNVGIGTSNPSSPLTVQANTGASAVKLYGRSDGISTIGFIGNNQSTEQGYLQGRDDQVRVWGGSNNFLSLGAGNSEAMRVSSTGNIGIGIDPSDKLHVYSGASGGTPHVYTELIVEKDGHNAIQLLSPDAYEQAIWFGDATSPTAGGLTYNHPTNDMSFRVNDSVQMVVEADGKIQVGNNKAVWSGAFGGALFLKGDNITSDRYAQLAIVNSTGAIVRQGLIIDNDGNLLIGTTSASGFLNSTSETGVINYQSGALGVSKSSDIAGYFKRLGNDGAIVELRNSSATTVGSINTRASQLSIGCTNTGLEFNDANDAVIPADINANNTRDNAISLGTAGVRFDDAFITNGVTTGSDERDKQDISALDEAETRVAVACKGLLRKWRWKDAVAEKDNNAESDKTARFHFGIIAQDLKAAFEAEGLDAERYGMFMYDTWTDEETDEERSRMGVRYSELLAFIIAAI